MRLISTKGSLAHLGERLHGMQEVAGSSPVGSTKINRLCLNNNWGFLFISLAIKISYMSNSL